ncbi:hypothetical protein [Micromonospora deserti]|uniref:hypothetical protein n=1 Tax=Micromonospora deserti TaxID=2070366 RepID=UPI00131474E2
MGDPLGGHLIQGNADAVGKVVRVDDDGATRRLWIKPPERFIPLVVAKGQIAVDGVSLTAVMLSAAVRSGAVAMVRRSVSRPSRAGVCQGSVLPRCA